MQLPLWAAILVALLPVATAGWGAFAVSKNPLTTEPLLRYAPTLAVVVGFALGTVSVLRTTRVGDAIEPWLYVTAIGTVVVYGAAGWIARAQVRRIAWRRELGPSHPPATQREAWKIVVVYAAQGVIQAASFAFVASAARL